MKELKQSKRTLWYDKISPISKVLLTLRINEAVVQRWFEQVFLLFQITSFRRWNTISTAPVAPGPGPAGRRWRRSWSCSPRCSCSWRPRSCSTGWAMEGTQEAMWRLVSYYYTRWQEISSPSSCTWHKNTRQVPFVLRNGCWHRVYEPKKRLFPS